MSKVQFQSQRTQFQNERSVDANSLTDVRSRKRSSTGSEQGIPTQSPPSRIGRPISEFIPSESTQLPSQPRQSLQDPRQSVTEYDRDGDGVVDLAVGRTFASTVHSNQPDNLSVHWNKDGADTVLWANEGGRVYWEQRTLPDGSFENSFDKNGDGAIDLLIRGRGRHVERFPEATGATREANGADVTSTLNVDPSMLAMPHAVLNADAIVLHRDAELQNTDVEARIPFSSFVPARDPASILSLELKPNWAGLSHTCTFDGEAITLAVKGTTANAWAASTPFLKVVYQGGGEATLALYAPKVLLDDRQFERVGLEESIASAQKVYDAQTRDIALLDSKIQLPDPWLPETKKLAVLDSEQQQLSANLDQLRPELLEHFIQNAAGRAAGLNEACSAGGLEPQQIAALKAALDLDKSGAATQAVVDSLKDANVLDFALAFSERHVSPGTGAFLQKIERQFMLQQEISMAQTDLELARASFVKEKTSVRNNLIAGRSETQQKLDGWTAALAANENAAPEARGTEHRLNLKVGN